MIPQQQSEIEIENPKQHQYWQQLYQEILKQNQYIQQLNLMQQQNLQNNLKKILNQEQNKKNYQEYNLQKNFPQQSNANVFERIAQQQYLKQLEIENPIQQEYWQQPYIDFLKQQEQLNLLNLMQEQNQQNHFNKIQNQEQNTIPYSYLPNFFNQGNKNVPKTITQNHLRIRNLTQQQYWPQLHLDFLKQQQNQQNIFNEIKNQDQNKEYFSELNP